MQINKASCNKKCNPWKLLVYQMWTHCHFSDLKGISKGQIETLALLCLDNGRYISSFCKELADRGFFKSPQSARNGVTNLIQNNLILRSGKDNRILIINPNIEYCSDSNILLTYNLLAIGTPEPPAFV